MKAIVDAALCTGCELCVSICPEAFDMADGVAKVKVDPIPADAEATCQESASSCPVEAIKIS